MPLQDFLQYLTIEKRYSPHTVLAYQHDIETYLAYLKESYEIEDSTQANSLMVRAWIVEMVEKGLQSKSVHRKISSIKSFYKFLMKLGHLKVSPAHGVVLPKLKKLLPTFVEESKMDILLDQVDFETSDFHGKRDKLIIEMLYLTGMRLSEIINLKISDVDLSDNSIKVLGKGNKERIIPVNIPPKDEGKTTSFIVCHLEAPKAKDASFNECGTAFIASLVATIIIGNIKSDNVKLPDNILPPKLKNRTKIPNPNNP